MARITRPHTFPEESFTWLAAKEEGHFWFEQRNELILWMIENFSGYPRRYLEVGCGTGFVLGRVARAFPQAEIHGIEYYEDAIPIARARCPTARIGLGDVLALEAQSLFDAVGCFDVLEHIPDDKTALTKLGQALSPGGRLFVSVPQHPWLWSSEDTLACHQRRYTKRGLQRLAQSSGLECVWCSSFVTLLAPLMLLRRLRPDTKPGDAGSASFEFTLPKPVNWVFGRFLAVERWFISRRGALPFGGSLMMVLERQR
jgi:SAM-dependent methyltransferase